ncbi:hypothetical protein NW768_010065 [Fusarium equiseti]|uniref:Uncharacterized protein n=1 Tax=Fusarium equiseti TaxID=61235 RepID=A0ABQ8R1V6_FUSEQ|nr:hypothetical protein NW768_010065 [Fusarium equiseti]
MKTTEVPPGAATASTNAQVASLQALINDLSEETKALAAKIEALEKSQVQLEEKYAAKLKDIENQIENPNNEEDDTDPELVKMQNDAREALFRELDPDDMCGPEGVITKELDAWSAAIDAQLKDDDLEVDLVLPPPSRPCLLSNIMYPRK